jgi:hypothetical protein
MKSTDSYGTSPGVGGSNGGGMALLKLLAKLLIFIVLIAVDFISTLRY